MRRVDDVWFRNGLVHTPYLQRFISRPTYYAINRHIMVDVCNLLAKANRQWRRAWSSGRAVTGDGTTFSHNREKGEKLRTGGIPLD